MIQKKAAYITFSSRKSAREIKIHEISFICEESVKEKKKKSFVGNYAIEFMTFVGLREFVEILNIGGSVEKV